MAYTPKTWECNETITAEDLNHMEQGIAESEELPAVTSEDNGKVLTVVNGQWEKAEPGSVERIHTFGAPITIPRTLSNNNGTASFDYTFPSDGYLFIDNQNNVASLGSIVLYGLTLNGQAFTRPLYYPSSGASSFNIKDEFIYVRQGMVLGGQFTLLNGYTENIKTYFIPFE